MEGLFPDEADALTLANLGNPAGVAWLPRGRRLDVGYARDTSDEFDAVGGTAIGQTSHRVNSPNGPYEMLTWAGARNVWQLGVDGGADIVLASLPAASPDLAGVTTFFDAQARFVAGYARRMTGRFALGGWVRPSWGGVGGLLALAPGAERTIAFSLNDYGAGAAMSFPTAGRGEGEAGISVAPFNDRLDLRDAVGLATGSSGALTDVGAYEVVQTLTFSNSVTQTWKTVPAGQTMALQGVWRTDGGGWEAAAVLEGTTARATQENRTEDLLPGGVQLVQQGLASTFSRTRVRLLGRHRRDLARGARIRYAASLLTARTTAERLDFPDSEDVLETRTTAPLEAALGVAWQTAAGHTVGGGLDGVRDRERAADAAGSLGERSLTRSASTLRVGWEYLFSPRWTGRAGGAWSTLRTRPDDPEAPAEPVRRDRALSAGAGFRSGWSAGPSGAWWRRGLAGVTPTDVDLTMVSHALSQSSRKQEGQAVNRSRREWLFAARWLF